MAELRECPFCGGTKLGFSSKTVSRDYNASHLFHGAIYCKNCNAYGARVLSEKVKNVYPSPKVDFDGLEKRAIEAWNRRYTPSEIEITPFEVGDTIRIPLPKDKKIKTYNGEEIDFDYEAED